MEIFKSANEIVKAIATCKDPKAQGNAIAVVVKFCLQDKSIVEDTHFTEPGLPNKIMLSILLLKVQEMGKPRKEVVKSEI